jgi:uncharacterized membrane protein YraQ (UPF0718 family)
MDMSVPAEGSLWRRITSDRGLTAIRHYFVMDFAAVWMDIVGGLVIAGAIAAWVPQDFWKGFFLTDHPVPAATTNGPRSFRKLSTSASAAFCSLDLFSSFDMIAASYSSQAEPGLVMKSLPFLLLQQPQCGSDKLACAAVTAGDMARGHRRGVSSDAPRNSLPLLR